MILAGSSHSARTLDSIDGDSINLLDATVPGFRFNPNNVAKMASEVRDLVEGTDPKNTVIVIQVQYWTTPLITVEKFIFPNWGHSLHPYE
jgi:hypothetical protein